MPTHFPTNLDRLNSLCVDDAQSELLKCCGSRNWARQIAASRPYSGLDELIRSADSAWRALEPGDWLEAFHSHPKIGEQKAAADTARDAQKWSAQEQSGVERSSADTLTELAELNRAYEEKFGFIFIICATGKSSDEMLASLRARLSNPPEVELQNAAAEQAKITELRIRKLIDAGQSK